MTSRARLDSSLLAVKAQWTEKDGWLHPQATAPSALLALARLAVPGFRPWTERDIAVAMTRDRLYPDATGAVAAARTSARGERFLVLLGTVKPDTTDIVIGFQRRGEDIEAQLLGSFRHVLEASGESGAIYLVNSKGGRLANLSGPVWIRYMSGECKGEGREWSLHDHVWVSRALTCRYGN
ncbi:hypothetical protein BH09GEM1_BH09GEM1_45400 [soil metagenome]